MSVQADEAAVAVREYEASRARYVRTMTADLQAKVMDAASKKRDALLTEINSLVVLAKTRNDVRTAAVRAYGERAPGKITPSGLLPPSGAERFGGVEKFYKAALKAAEEFNEVNDLLQKRRRQLGDLDDELRAVLKQQSDEFIRVLETPEGLSNAFKRDPLLGKAHQRMERALKARAQAAAPPAAPAPPAPTAESA